MAFINLLKPYEKRLRRIDTIGQRLCKLWSLSTIGSGGWLLLNLYQLIRESGQWETKELNQFLDHRLYDDALL